MKKFVLFFCTIVGVFAQEDVVKTSEAIGHIIGKNLQDLGLDLDISAVVKGILDAKEGKESPLNEDESVQAIATLQEEHLNSVAKKNLSEAENFLSQNQHEKGIVSLEAGKLQYRIGTPGTGEVVQTYNSPILRYKGHMLNGSPLAGGEELVTLDETMIGFSKGIVGMREGEVRTLFVHPDLGVGKRDPTNPNSLLIFEVELIKADASTEAREDARRQLFPYEEFPAR